MVLKRGRQDPAQPVGKQVYAHIIIIQDRATMGNGCVYAGGGGGMGRKGGGGVP